MGNMKEIKKKIILLGDGAVGKTSLIRKYVVDKFDDKYLLTVGFKITQKEIPVKIDKKVHYLKLNIWDILGQKGFIELHKSSLPGTSGCILVADITRKDTLKSIDNYWIPNVYNMVGPVPFVVLGNKMDLIEKAEFNEEELMIFAKRYGAPSFMTSAKTGENVKNAFLALGQRILQADELKAPKPLKAGIIQVERNEVAELIDKIIGDFCSAYGRSEDAMPVLRKQFELAKLDLESPRIEAITMAINRLAKVEVAFKGVDVAERNRAKRLKWVKEFRMTKGKK
jgi:small GTP-binding protein